MGMDEASTLFPTLNLLSNSNSTDRAEFTFLALFMVEMVVKMYGLGFRLYFQVKKRFALID